MYYFKTHTYLTVPFLHSITQNINLLHQYDNIKEAKTYSASASFKGCVVLIMDSYQITTNDSNRLLKC